MDYTEELLSKAKAAASAADLQAVAREYNIELSDADAAEYFDFLNSSCSSIEDGAQELSAAEMEMVAGGKGDVPSEDVAPRFSVGQTVIFSSNIRGTIVAVHYDNDAHNWKYDVEIAMRGSVFHNLPLESPGCPIRVIT